ncbi:MAG: BRCT domain-containing protein [Novosphingobium sp.]
MITFRVDSSSEEELLYSVSVDSDGRASCDCEGFGRGRFCRHIDAVLVSGEWAMVPENYRAAAAKAMELARGKITSPTNWKATWRKDWAWRGLSATREPINPRRSGKPLVCFTGTLPGKKRADWLAEAKNAGWDTTDEPSPFTDVLVAKDPNAASAKLKKARDNRTVIVSADEWADVMLDGVLPDV